MKQKTILQLPFNGKWFTNWGGDTKELNRHSGLKAQQYAFDFIIIDKNNSSYSGEGADNEDYYAFGKDVISPVNGTVVEAVDGLRDNRPGTTNDYMFAGNYILIKHADKEFSFLAHFREGSLRVKGGDKVTTGQKLGECGNSGNTTEPHIHYHVQNSDIFARFSKEYKRIEVARGIKVYFSDIEAKTKDGVEIKSKHSPIRGETVRNI